MRICRGVLCLAAPVILVACGTTSGSIQYEWQPERQSSARSEQPPSLHAQSSASRPTSPSPASESPPPLAPRPSSPSPASLDALIRAAAERSPELRAAHHNWRAAVARVPQARSLPDPELGYGYFVQRMDTRQQFRLTQMFPWFGTLDLRESAAGEEAAAAALRLEATALRVVAEVRRTYAEYAYVERAVVLVRENRDLVRDLESVVRRRYEAGDTGQADVLRLQMEREALSDRLRSLEDRRRSARAAVNVAAGRPAAAELEPPEDLPRPEVPDLTQRSVEEWLRDNPELLALGRETRGAREQSRLARNENRPDFMLGVEYMDNPGGMDDAWMGMVSVSLPVWRERNRARIDEARARENALREEHAGLALRLEGDLEEAFYRMRDADRQWHLFENELIPRARQSLNVLRAGYRAGREDFLDLLEAQRSVLEQELSRERAAADLFQRVAEWERLTGRPVEAMVNENFEYDDGER